ncbi:putative UPF0481 protein At3g02645 isoform X1 [Cryptomeria japonica]|uniref:putative UPF0481 protein At3g02645 isoform X1 n=1 Tax=Cryptomeria japonica TaxID=3369 RepID=UPI0027DA3DE7|nr:putative UPF0481 protein At3g02645 isoform X1 [Cryptomeria japonica]
MSSPNFSDSNEKKPGSESWVVEVKNYLKEVEETASRTSLKVPMALIKAKPEAYVPQMVSLGPYHHHSLQEELMGSHHQRLHHLSQMDFYKLESARDATKDKPTLIDYFFSHVTEMTPDFEQFYNWKIEDPKRFGMVMMMDGFFLYQVLKNGLHDLEGEVNLRNNEIPQPTLTSIRCDIMKLENQIPLSLLFEIDNSLYNKTLESCLNSHIPHLSSFQLSDNLNIDYEDEHHLLACVHKYVSSFLQTHNPQEGDKPRNRSCCEHITTALDDMVAAVFGIFFPHPAKQGRGDFLDRYNAKELVKIVISDTYTEVVMRNLLALEFNDATRPKYVTQYVELMNCLIDTPEDVALLREYNVIDRHSMNLTDEYVVKMWEGLAKTMFFSAFVEKPQGMKAAIRETLIKNYYKSKIRNWLNGLPCRPFGF